MLRNQFSNDIDYSEVYEILINTKGRDLLIFLSW